MNHHRITQLVFLLVILVAGVHCGDYTNVPDIVIVNPDSGLPPKLPLVQDADSGLPDQDAGNAPDSSQDAPGCVSDETPVSDRCSIAARCNGGPCGSLDSFVYQCFDSGGGTRPDIKGCQPMAPTGEVQQWCCPPSCVHAPTLDPQCPGQGHFYFCPMNDDGGTNAALPTSKCTRVDHQGVAVDYCCNE